MEESNRTQTFSLPVPGRSRPVRITLHEFGRPDAPALLLLHGPSGGACEFRSLLGFLGADFHALAPDLAGFGDSEAVALTYAEHCAVLGALIARLNLKTFLLAGHHTGGRLALELVARHPELARRIERIALFGTPPAAETPARELVPLVTASERNTLLRYADSVLTAYLLYEPFFADAVKMPAALLADSADALARREIRRSMIETAGFFAVPPDEKLFTELQTAAVPVLLVTGSDDPARNTSAMHKLALALGGMRVETIAGCGGAPQLEAPAECAALTLDFLHSDEGAARPVRSRHEAPHPTESYSLKMRKLIDKWSVSTVLLLGVLKLLQLLKKCGLKPSENGWRKVTGIFLANEYSKFTLASFRLRYAATHTAVTGFDEARRALATRLGHFLQQEPSFRWSVTPHALSLSRKRLDFSDLVVADTDAHGRLRSIQPLLDRANPLDEIPHDLRSDALDQFVLLYNALPEGISDRARPKKLKRRLLRFVMTRAGFNYSTQMLMRTLIDRLMNATYLYMSVLPSDNPLQARLATPNFRILRNPGWGMLNVIARFTPDFAEADLWFQCHHVPVDGVPMQELLDKLKRTWGSGGRLKFPAAGTPAASPEVMYCGQRVFRARVFADFTSFLAVRDHLNRTCAEEMGGSATIASMLIWGLARHDFFRMRKMFFPVDTSELAGPRGERELSLVFIRPSTFFNERDPLAGFLAFEREFNRQLRETRFGRSESYELLDLISLSHPVTYQLARLLIPDALSEIVGTVGISVIRQAEMFISPLSDFNVHGFMALCNIATPTEDGKTAGAVSICASRDLIHSYLEAIDMIAAHYPRLVGLPETITEAAEQS